jgi:hypothetical protein
MPPRSYHNTLDLIEREGVGGAIVELVVFGEAWAAICCACSSVPPFVRYVVMPVARNV